MVSSILFFREIFGCEWKEWREHTALTDKVLVYLYNYKFICIFMSVVLDKRIFKGHHPILPLGTKSLTSPACDWRTCNLSPKHSLYTDIILCNLCSELLSLKTLVLFEVLDSPPSLSGGGLGGNRKNKASRAKTYTRLGWAFLVPVGKKGMYSMR